MNDNQGITSILEAGNSPEETTEPELDVLISKYPKLVEEGGPNSIQVLNNAYKHPIYRSLVEYILEDFQNLDWQSAELDPSDSAKMAQRIIEFIRISKHYTDFLKTNGLTIDEIEQAREEYKEYEGLYADIFKLPKIAGDLIPLLVEIPGSLNDKATDIDKLKYAQYFNTPLPEVVFNEFKNMPSVQGTLAASEIIAQPEFASSLGRELNMTYPGAGADSLAILTSFDLIERQIIDSANFLYIDRHEQSDYVDKFLQRWQEHGVISDLTFSSLKDEPPTYIFKFKYRNKPVSLTTVTTEFQALDSWDPNGRPMNAIYDHLPYQSAPAGSATKYLATRPDLHSRRDIIHIIPAAVLDMHKEFYQSDIKAAAKRPGVCFADKYSWSAREKNGFGVNVVLMKHSN